MCFAKAKENEILRVLDIEAVRAAFDGRWIFPAGVALLQLLLESCSGSNLNFGKLRLAATCDINYNFVSRQLDRDPEAGHIWANAHGYLDL